VVYTAALAGEVTAVDAETGDELWQVELTAGISAGLGWSDGNLLVASRDGKLHMLSSNDGSEVWQVSTSSEVLAVPQTANNVILVQAIDGRLTAYGVKQGELLWSYASDLPNLTLRGTSTPVIDGSVSYAGFANGKLLAFDNQKGKIIWQQRISAPKGRSDMERLVDIDGPLQLVDGTLYVTAYQGNLTAVDALTGKIQWQQPISSFQAPAIYGGQVFVVTDKGSVMAYDRQTGTEMWRNDDFLHRGLSAALALDNLVMVLDGLGYAHLLDQATGVAVGRYKLGHDGSGVGFVRHGNHVFVLGQDASLTRLSLD
jgi:outer membrane protein assembly factor BamB